MALNRKLRPQKWSSFPSLVGSALLMVGGWLLLSFWLLAHSQAAPGSPVWPAAFTDATTRIVQGNKDITALSVSTDGTIFAFASAADDLLAGDTNTVSDIFIFDSRTEQINRASLTDDGAQANGASYTPALSADGRYVVFASDATNLVTGDTNGRRDIFVRDLVAGRTTRVSINSAGQQSNGDCFNPHISADGRYVVFESDASNLAPNDTNGRRDIFVFDRSLGSVRRVSVATNGAQANGDSFMPFVSADGRNVVYESPATNLVTGDTNNVTDIFLHDLHSAVTRRLSVSAEGAEGDGPSTLATISADNNYVAFRSFSTNLVSGDTNASWDIFVVSLASNAVEIVSRSSDGAQGNPALTNPNITPARAYFSSTGRYVVFQSDASNLVPGDTNGKSDIFLRDRQMSTTELLSVSSTGAGADAHALSPVVSSDGRYAAFLSAAYSLGGGGNGSVALFLRDRQTPAVSPTPTATSTPLPTATVTATPVASPTPTSTPTPPVRPVVRLMMPLVFHMPVLYEPVLDAVDNGDYDNRYTVTWQSAGAGAGYRLEEARSADFAGARVVYEGTARSWQVVGRTPGVYHYRVRPVAGDLLGPWSNATSVTIYPLFVGLELVWQGVGAMTDKGVSTDIGYFWDERVDRYVDGLVTIQGRQWFAPNPQQWPEESWSSQYDVQTGAYIDTTLAPDPNARWGNPWLLPYALSLHNLKAVYVDGQIFDVSGPFQSTTVFGKAVRYWRLINRSGFVYWADGLGNTQHVNSGDCELWYEADGTGLLLRQALVRRIYSEGNDTGDTIRYDVNLVAANAFP